MSVPMVPMAFVGAVQLLDVTPDANVTAVLTAISTYAESLVASVTTWMTSFIPIMLPVAGIAIAFFFGLRLLKRAGRG